MKTIGKSKIYMLVAIMAVLVLSVGLSFCVWDTDSLNLQINGKSATFGNDDYILGYDANSNNVADVGDTVWFGNYFQQANETTKTPLEWRVVDIREENGKDVMYLLSVKIHAFGSFWGSSSYYDKNGVLIEPVQDNQRYNDSTVRAWLNSSARSDDGTGFDAINSNRKIFNGFYNEAFSDNQKNLIIARTIPGMSGSFYGDTTPKVIKQYDTLTSEKVWIPSYTEIYGVNYGYFDGDISYFNDNSSDRQLSYFKGVSNTQFVANPKLEGTLSAYSVSGLACYVNINATHPNNFTTRSEGLTYAWRLRSPVAMNEKINLKAIGVAHVQPTGYPSYTAASRIPHGIRPSICLAK